MKTTKKIVTIAVAIVAGTATLVCSLASDPSIPVGTLDAYPTKVQAGTKPTLTWDITHPDDEVVDIDPPGELDPLEDLYMDIRVIGASFQSSPGNWKPIQAWVKVGGGGWNDFFYNTQPNVNPTHIYHTQLVQEGQKINFGGRYNWSGWGTFHNTTQSNSQNMIALRDGDSPPSYAPAFNQGNVEAFLDPYIDSNGNIDIGPMDVIYLFELYSTSPGSSYFDMQDLVVLVTFRRVPS